MSVRNGNPHIPHLLCTSRRMHSCCVSDRLWCGEDDLAHHVVCVSRVRFLRTFGTTLALAKRPKGLYGESAVQQATKATAVYHSLRAWRRQANRGRDVSCPEYASWR